MKEWMEFRSKHVERKKETRDDTSEDERKAKREREIKQGNKQQDQKGEIVNIFSHIPVIIIIIKWYSKNSFIHRSFHCKEERNLLYLNGAISLTVRIYVIRLLA